MSTDKGLAKVSQRQKYWESFFVRKNVFLFPRNFTLLLVNQKKNRNADLGF